MTEIIARLNEAFTLAFVVSSMFGLGLAMTVRDLVRPLRNIRLVSIALLINFALLPAVAWAITRLLPLEPDLRIGLILMSTVAGAPLTIKATQVARGDVLAAGSLVTLQVIVTVVYLPLVLPWLVPGITIDSIAIAAPLVIQVLLPLGAGMLMNARYDEEAEMTRPIMAEISNISLGLILVMNLGNISEVVSLIGTGALASAIAIILVGLGAGYALGGPDPKSRRTLGLGSAQRNYAAAFVLAQGSFATRPGVFVMLLTAALLSMVIVLLAAGELGRKRRRLEREAAPDPVASSTWRST